MADTSDSVIDRLRAVAATSRLRSPLARWFSVHHDEFGKLLRDYRPRWEALVEQFATDGLLVLPAAFNDDDPHVREVTRRRVVKAAMRTWERAKVKVAKRMAPAHTAAGHNATNARPLLGQPVPDLSPTGEEDEFELHDVMGRPITG
jgi:hypothetical protein